jgi:hypothetical protein
MIGDASVAEVHRAVPAGDHWDALRALVTLHCSISRVAVGDGRRTSFWHDS